MDVQVKSSLVYTEGRNLNNYFRSLGLCEDGKLLC